MSRKVIEDHSWENNVLNVQITHFHGRFSYKPPTFPTLFEKLSLEHLKTQHFITKLMLSKNFEIPRYKYSFFIVLIEKMIIFRQTGIAK